MIYFRIIGLYCYYNNIIICIQTYICKRNASFRQRWEIVHRWWSSGDAGPVRRPSYLLVQNFLHKKTKQYLLDSTNSIYVLFSVALTSVCVSQEKRWRFDDGAQVTKSKRFGFGLIIQSLNTTIRRALQTSSYVVFIFWKRISVRDKILYIYTRGAAAIEPAWAYLIHKTPCPKTTHIKIIVFPNLCALCAGESRALARRYIPVMLITGRFT